jgi:hypothetical protein
MQCDHKHCWGTNHNYNTRDKQQHLSQWRLLFLATGCFYSSAVDGLGAIASKQGQRSSKNKIFQRIHWTQGEDTKVEGQIEQHGANGNLRRPVTKIKIKQDIAVDGVTQREIPKQAHNYIENTSKSRRYTGQRKSVLTSHDGAVKLREKREQYDLWSDGENKHSKSEQKIRSHCEDGNAWRVQNLNTQMVSI